MAKSRTSFSSCHRDTVSLEQRDTGPFVSYRPAACPFEKGEWSTGESRLWGWKPNWNKWCACSAWPHGPDSWEGKDGWVSVGRLAQEEGIGFYWGKQDGWMRSEPPCLHGEWLCCLILQKGSVRGEAGTSHLTDNKQGGRACWKVGQEQAGLL